MEKIIYISLIVASVVFIIYLWTESSKNKKNISQNMNVPTDNKESFALKMQAYERLSLFLERSKPQSLLMRLMGEVKEKEQLQLLMLNTLREEFEHNFSQQIYVSENLWQNISFSKDRLIQLINTSASSESVKTAHEFGEKLLLDYSNEKEDYIGNTLQQLRQEARIIQGQ